MLLLLVVSLFPSNLIWKRGRESKKSRRWLNYPFVFVLQ